MGGKFLRRIDAVDWMFDADLHAWRNNGGSPAHRPSDASHLKRRLSLEWIPQSPTVSPELAIRGTLQ
jgi:hypothetical protein